MTPDASASRACMGCGTAVARRKPSAYAATVFCGKACFYANRRLAGSRPRTGKTRACQVCGEKFYAAPGRPNTRFCSMKCKGVASRKPRRQCETCGARVERLERKQRFCSQGCSGAARRKKVLHACLSCSVTFSAAPERRLCSRECQFTWQRRTKLRLECLGCGKPFVVSPSSASQEFCSRKCWWSSEKSEERLRQLNVLQQRGATNKLELAGLALLSSIGLRCEPQRLLFGKFCVDAYNESLRLVVQFDGDYWHGNPEKYPEPNERQRRRIDLDRSQDAYMKKCGVAVVRLWEHEVHRDNHLALLKLLPAWQKQWRNSEATRRAALPKQLPLRFAGHGALFGDAR